MFFDPDTLAKIMSEVLSERNVDPNSIQHVVASVIQTSLRGVDSHGINLFPHYAKAAEVGRVNPRPRFTIEKTGESTAIFDADHGFGHHSGADAMDFAIDMALKTGIGATSVRNSTHFGAAAYFGLRAPSRGCLGFSFTNADALVKAFGTKTAFFGTNPICFTAPMEKEDPFCLDMATSIVSWNKIKLNRQTNTPIPASWAFDRDGNSVTDPHAAAFLAPSGEYKGFGLGMMVDILCALLASGPISKDLMAMYTPPPDSQKRKISHFFLAISISRFLPLTSFKENIQAIVDRIRAIPPQTAGSNVMVAGDPEKRAFVVRSESGIPIEESKFSEFLTLSPKFSQALRQ
ncbi:MAG: Ldh family oxidoreductase [Candidatus Ozemobacteraceae bacterium]